MGMSLLKNLCVCKATQVARPYTVVSFGCKERLCLKIWGRAWLRKILDINFGPTSTGIQSAHTHLSMCTHIHTHHICTNIQIVIVIWLLSYAPTSEPIIEWGELSGNSDGKWSSFSLQTLSSEILWRPPSAASQNLGCIHTYCFYWFWSTCVLGQLHSVSCTKWFLRG